MKTSLTTQCGLFEASISIKYNQVVHLFMLRRFIGLCLLVIAFIFFIWGVLPTPLVERSLSLSAEELAFSGLDVESAAGVGKVQIRWPEILRRGDPGEIRLDFQLEPVLVQMDSAPPGLMARIELAGMPHTPTGEVSQALSRDRPVSFVWRLRPNRPGDYSGQIWLYLRDVSLNGEGAERRLLVVQDVMIQAVDFVGLNGDQGRVFGALGMVLGAWLGLDSQTLTLLRRLVIYSKGINK